MAKKTYIKDNLSPASTFGGDHVVKITDKEGRTFKGRGHTREKADERAEEKYDDYYRGR